MHDGWLDDGDVAVLARQAVELLAPGIAIDIEPQSSADPYRWSSTRPGAWTVWPRVDGRQSFGVNVTAGLTPVAALAHLLGTLSDECAETERFWGVAWPACPGHRHPAEVVDDGDAVVIRCPDTGVELDRVRPDVTG